MHRFFTSHLSRVLLALIAIAVLALAAVRGVMDPLLCFDPWQYHLPFAAALWDIGHAQEYSRVFFEGRFKGFGLLANWLQGMFWSLFGSVNFVPLVNFIPYVAMLLVARAWFRVPVAFLAFYTLSMPLIAIHVTSGYIDLFVGSMLMLMIMGCLRLLQLLKAGSTPLPLMHALLAIAVGAGMAGNAKLYALAPIICVIGITFFAIYRIKKLLFSPTLFVLSIPAIHAFCRNMHAELIDVQYAIMGFIAFHIAFVLVGIFQRGMRHRVILCALVLITLVSGATAIKNVAQYNNPFHPFQNPYYDYGITFFQPAWKRYYEEQQKYYLIHYDKPIYYRAMLFLSSLTEIDLLIYPPKRFMYAEASQTGDYRIGTKFHARSGGFFGPLIVASLLFLGLGYRALYKRGHVSAELRFGLLFLLLLTGLFSVLAQSYELRYCFVWAMLLGLLLGMLMQQLWKDAPAAQQKMQWALFVLLVGTQLFLPLQRTLYDVKWQSYYPEAIKAKLDPQTLLDFRELGLGCFPRTPAPYQYEGFGACDSSRVVYSPSFINENYRYFWVTDERECDELITKKRIKHTP